MVKGHENNTYELTDEELKLAKAIIPHFKKKTKSNPVKAKDIVNGINSHYKLKKKFSEVRLRKIVNYYRTNSIIPIISTSNGYYVSYDENDINEMIESLTQRASSIIECAFGMKRLLIKENI